MLTRDLFAVADLIVPMLISVDFFLAFSNLTVNVKTSVSVVISLSLSVLTAILQANLV